MTQGASLVSMFKELYVADGGPSDGPSPTEAANLAVEPHAEQSAAAAREEEQDGAEGRNGIERSLELQMVEQERRRGELGEYMAHLKVGHMHRGKSPRGREGSDLPSDQRGADTSPSARVISTTASFLQSLRDEEGGQLVELPRNYLAMVEGLIRKNRGESSALQGWLGPTRFEGEGRGV